MANGPRPSNQPVSLIPASALLMNSRNASAPRYPPVVPSTSNASSCTSSSPSPTGPAGAAGPGSIANTEGPGAEPVPKAMLAIRSLCSVMIGVAVEANGQGPARVDGRRDIAHRLVARLIAKARGYRNLSHLQIGRELELHPNRELPLEHAQGLVDPLLSQISRLRVDDLRHRDAWRRRDRQDDRNEGGVARRVRIDVKAFG